jgi:hypothetical protein
MVGADQSKPTGATGRRLPASNFQAWTPLESDRQNFLQEPFFEFRTSTQASCKFSVSSFSASCQVLPRVCDSLRISHDYPDEESQGCVQAHPAARRSAGVRGRYIRVERVRLARHTQDLDGASVFLFNLALPSSAEAAFSPYALISDSPLILDLASIFSLFCPFVCGLRTEALAI